MVILSTSRSIANTPTDHINDHNEIHRLHDILDGSAGPSLALATLDARYLTSDLARVILSRQAGIDPTGATDCAAALQTVINATATAGKQLLWDCKILTSATVITLPTNTDIVGCGWSTSQLIGGWTLTSTGGYYVTNADRNGGNTGIRVSNLQITGAGDGTPWGNATNPVTGFALAHCSDFEISRVRAYHIPGISFSGQSCFHGKWDVDVYGSGRDGLNNTYIGGEMHDLTIDISAYLVGDDGVTVNSSPTGGPLNGTAVTVATTAGSNAIVASAPTSPVWTTGQTIVIAGAASGGLALEATLHVVDSTHATLMVPGGTESTVGIPAVLSVGAASAWYGVYRPYNVVIRSFDIYGAPATVTQGAGRGIYIAGSDVTLGDGVINSTYSSGIRIQSDFVTTALYSKVTAGNVVIRNAGAVGGGTSSQPRDGVNIDGALSVEFSSLRIDQHYNRGIYATHCINLQCGSAHISNGGQASIDFGIDLDGITGTNYQVDTVNLNGLIVEGQSGNGIRCNMARRVTINGTIKNNGRLKAGTVNDWGILYIGDATTEATISGVITDTRAAGQKTQLGPVFIQTPGAPFVLFTNLIAYGNINTDISSTGAAVVLRRNVLSHGTTLTANYDQDSTGAKHYTAPSSPQGVISAPVGSTYRQTDGVAGWTFWTKTSGTGNTGWTAAAPTLAVAATVTAAGPLVVNKHNPIDATAGPLTMTLPTGQPQGSIIICEKYDSTANAVTISGNIRGSASTDVLVLAHQTTMFEADAAGSWWPVASHKALATLDTRYNQIDSLVINVKDHGAKGDGVTDDTAAVQSALTAAAGKRAWFPSGTYLVYALSVPGGTVVDMGTATIKRRPTIGGDQTTGAFTGNPTLYTGTGYAMIFYVTGDNVTFLRGTIDGNRANDTLGTGATWGGSGAAQAQRAGIQASSSDIPAVQSLVVDGVRFINMVGVAINVDLAGSCRIVNCRETNAANLFACVTGGWVDLVTRGTLEFCNNEMAGDRVQNNVPNPVVLDRRASIVCTGNTFDETLTATAGGCKIQDSNQVVIANNTFINTFIKPQSAPTWYGDSFVITGNTFTTSAPSTHNTGITFGLHRVKTLTVTANSIVNGCIVVERSSDNVTVADNTIRCAVDSRLGATGVYYAIQGGANQNSSHCGNEVVANNLIDLNSLAFHCFYFALNDLGDVDLRDNTVFGADNVVGFTAQVDTTAVRIRITGNTFRNFSALGRINLNGITDLVIANNIMSGWNATAPSNINGGATREWRITESGTQVNGTITIKGNICNLPSVASAIIILTLSTATADVLDIQDNLLNGYDSASSGWAIGKTGTGLVGLLIVKGNVSAGDLSIGTATVELIEGNIFTNAIRKVIGPTAKTVAFNGTVATTVGAAGGASALPATPTGYAVTMIDGTARKVPYYA